MNVSRYLRLMAAVCGSAITALGPAISTSARRLAQPPLRVAVFDEPGFPNMGGETQVSPVQIARDLHSEGIAADVLDADRLANEARFNSSLYTAVVLPNGNAYPMEAFANLRRFHQHGGSLIATGIPFTHAFVRQNENGRTRWVDQGHRPGPALWGANGIGIGGFDGPDARHDGAPTKIPAADPLQVVSLFTGPIAFGRGTQWLDPHTVPTEDAILPVIGTRARPMMALIVHKGDGFDGAVDAWLYRSPDAGDDQVYNDRQILERAIVDCLFRRGALAPAQHATALSFLASLPRPKVYANLVLPIPPRPYATFQPKMPPLSRHLYAADIRRLSHDEKLMLISLEGIVNRTQPRIYLIFDDDDRAWLDELQRQKATDAPVLVEDPWSLVDTFRDSIKGAVVCDPKVYVTPCVAVSLAGADDLIIAMTPALAERVHVPVKVDLRGKFKNDTEALRYIRTDLLPRLNPYLTFCQDPASYDSGSPDQIIAARGSAFWMTGPRAQGVLPGADQAGEMEAVRALLADLPLGAVVRGFWWRGDGMGIDESMGVAMGSRLGKITLVSDLISNLSVHSGVDAGGLKQKPRLPAPKLDPTKVYLCFTMSDGDNLCTWRGYFRKYYNDPARGTFPLGWGMGPALVDLAPDWARWYYENATPNDEFFCDVSGVAYMYPSSWGTSLKDRPAAFNYFYGRTEEYMKRMDMKTVRLMDVRARDIAHVAPLLPNVEFLMPDYGIDGDFTYHDLTYTLPTGQAIFRAATNGSGPENLAKQIRTRAGAARPAFLNAFIWNWGSSLGDLKKTLDILGPGYVAVTPSQLNTLYKEATAKPMAAAK